MILVAVALAGILAGCAPASEPAPTPTSAFTDEAEAFAAAEETYRAYVDALNAVDLSDPETFEDVYAWTTGDANAGARESFSEMHADQLTVDGTTKVNAIAPSPTQEGNPEHIELDVCLDVSDVTLVNREGTSVVAEDRRDIQTMRVTVQLASEGSPTSLISEIDGRDDGLTCSE
nr:hypothetical protein GCM10025699_24740 [Microbacterium flavescens]